MNAFFRKTISCALSLSLVLSMGVTAFASQALGDDLDLRETELHQGTQLGEGTFWSNTYSDLRQESYIDYHPNTAVTPIVTYGEYVTKTSTVPAIAKSLEAQGLRVVAGINGDYFGVANGVPLGTVMTQGVLRNATRANYAAGFRADGSAILGEPKLEMTALAPDDTTIPISAINQVRYSYSGIYLYTHDFNSRRTTGTSEEGYDVICTALDGRLSIGETLTLRVDRIAENAVDTTIAENEFVLTANRKVPAETLELLQKLHVGDTVSVTVRAADSGWNDVDYMIGALYELVHDGEVARGLEAGAAPRTAVGQRADGSVILYTIDGRRAGYSIGATLTQVAQRLVELGCVEALSLDGGGSTTLCLTQPDATVSTVYNRPSDNANRAVTNHIFLVAPAEGSGKVDHIYLHPESTLVLPGAKVALRTAAIDAQYIPIDGAMPTLSVDRGSIEDGALIAPDSGTASVTAAYGGKSADAEVRVVENPAKLTLKRDGKAVTSLVLSPGETVKLDAGAVWNHLNISGGNECFSWSVSNGAAAVTDGVLTAASHAASGELTVSVGSASVTIPVTVTTEAVVLVNACESADGQDVFTLAADKTHVYRGRGAYRWDYTADGSCYASLPITLPAPCLRFWVYGDGGNEMLSVVTADGTVECGAIDFTGWKLLTVRPGSNVSGLLITAPHNGTLWFDHFTAASDETYDTTAPAVSLSLTDGKLSGRAFDETDGTSLASLALTVGGFATDFSYDKQSGTLTASLPAAGALPERIILTAADNSGNIACTGIDLPAAGETHLFTDTEGHWANGYIAALNDSGVIAGDGAGHFLPDSNITREAFAVMLCRYLAPEQSFSSVTLPFADAADISDWANDGVRAMYALGVTTGSRDLRGELCFNPKAGISRQEAVTMLGRLLENGFSAPALTFSDSADIAAWAESHVRALCAIGAVSGSDDGRFHPNDPMTRAQVATVLFKLG